MPQSNTTERRKTIYIRVDPMLHRRAKVLAARLGISLEDIGRQALMERLSALEKEEAHGGRAGMERQP